MTDYPTHQAKMLGKHISNPVRHEAIITRRSRCLSVSWMRDGEDCGPASGTVRQCLEAVPWDGYDLGWCIARSDGRLGRILLAYGYANPTHGFEDLLSGADSITVEWEE